MQRKQDAAQAAIKNCGLTRQTAHHGVSLNAIDEDGYGAHSLLLHARNQLPNVHLLSDDMLTIQEYGNCGMGGIRAKGPMPVVPLHVCCRAGKEAVIVRVQATCIRQS